MEEEDNIIVKWAQKDVETSYNLLNKNPKDGGLTVLWYVALTLGYVVL